MAIVVQPYRTEHEPAVREFNQRLRAASLDPHLVFYERAEPGWLPKIEGASLYNEYFVAVEGQAVRGAYALKHETIFISGRGDCAIACYHHPLSEGIINRAYTVVGSLLLRDALSRQPLLYALGMGGSDRPLPRMLRAVGWNLHFVPFYFRVIRPYRFLRQMQALRQQPWRRFLMDLGAFTGTGWAVINAAQKILSLLAEAIEPFEVEQVREFSDWADTLWSEAKDAYAMTAVRDGATLRNLYAADDLHFTRLRISRGTVAIGWAVVGGKRADPKYGAMRVGSIVDCWASPDNALPVLLAAAHALEAQGVDLVVSNQNHQAWGRALENCGFLKAESNFIFAGSKQLSEILQPFDEKNIHITRADGDGLPRNF
jgi:hypothetical protein